MALLGFRRLKSSGGGGGRSNGGRRSSGGGGGEAPSKFTDAQAVSIISARLGTNPTQAEMVKAYQDLSTITGKGQPEAQIEMVKLETKSRELAQEQGDINSGIDEMENTLGQNLNIQASSNFSDPFALSGAYAGEYGRAEEEVYAKIDDLMASGRGSEASISALRAKAKEYGEKAIWYGRLRQSYYSTPEGGTAGPVVDTQYAYVPRINPDTGKMAGVDIVDAATMNKDDNKNKYMLTDMPVRTAGGAGKSIPLYLPITEVSRTLDDKPIMGAIFDGVTYKQKDLLGGKGTTAAGAPLTKLSDGLVAEEADEGGVLGAWKNQDAVDRNNRIKNARTNGLDLSQGMQFDSTDPGNDVIVQAGSKLFYKNSVGQMQEIDGANEGELSFFNGPGSTQKKTRKEVITGFLRSQGKDQKTIDRTLGQMYQLSVKDVSRFKQGDTISEGYFSKGLPAPAPPAALPQRPMTNAGVAGQAAGQAIGAATKFFAGRAPAAPAAPSNPSVPNKPDVAPESSGGMKSAGDIIAKGASFFGGLLTNPAK